MGAAASVPPSPLFVDGEEAPRDTVVNLKGLPDAIDNAVYTDEKWPLIIDTDGDASRFLKYQRGSFLLGFNPMDMEAEKLRQLLIGALSNGSNMTIKYRTFENGVDDLAKYFVPGSFPAEILNKPSLLDEAVWSTLLRPEKGDKKPHEFTPMESFCLIIIVEDEDGNLVLPEEVHKWFSVIRVGAKKGGAGGEGGGGGGEGAEDGVAAMFGAKEVKKNSKDLVEYGFDGELDEIKALVDKGFHIDSEDGREHTALSEAAAQGHNHVIEWLLQQGADPNFCNDQGRSPMYRAAFNGHSGTIALLLESGADRELIDRSTGERPFDCAKDDETRKVIDEWDYAKTTVLLEKRKAEIQRKLEERIRTAADREALARMLITKELCDKAEKGDVEGLKSQLLELAFEAESTSKRPLVTSEARNERGQTLLSLACQYNHIEVVKLLCDHHKTCDEDDFSLGPGEHSWEYRVFKANVNSKDSKGWNCAAIATFHENKACLKYLLNNGADPTIKNSYRKSAIDLAQDELDAALNVVVDHSEIRSVLEDWDNGNGSKLFGTGKVGVGGGGLAEGVAPEEPLPKDGTAMAMQLEIGKEGTVEKVAGGKGGGKKGKGKGKGKGTGALKKRATAVGKAALAGKKGVKKGAAKK